jgi:hypothetical protein
VFEHEHSNWLTLDTSPGITFTATVAIHEGAILLSHLRSIQNKTSDTGIIFETVAVIQSFSGVDDGHVVMSPGEQRMPWRIWPGLDPVHTVPT